MLWRLHRLAKGGHKGGHWHAVLPRRLRQRGRVDLHLHRRAVDKGRRGFGDQPQGALGAGQCPLDQQHGAQLGCIGKQAPHLACAKEAMIERAFKNGCGHG